MRGKIETRTQFTIQDSVDIHKHMEGLVMGFLWGRLSCRSHPESLSISLMWGLWAHRFPGQRSTWIYSLPGIYKGLVTQAECQRQWQHSPCSQAKGANEGWDKGRAGLAGVWTWRTHRRWWMATTNSLQLSGLSSALGALFCPRLSCHWWPSFQRPLSECSQ